MTGLFSCFKKCNSIIPCCALYFTCILQVILYALFVAHLSKPTSKRVPFVAAGLLAGVGALLSSLWSCTVSTPFRGPGYSNGTPGSDGDVIVAVTHATLHRGNRSAFDKHTSLVIKDIPTHAGYLGHSVRKQLFGNEVWTLSVWRDHVSLDEFVRAPVHREAIKQGIDAIIEAQFLRFEWPASSPPPRWSETLERLKSAPPIRY